MPILPRRPGGTLQPGTPQEDNGFISSHKSERSRYWIYKAFIDQAGNPVDGKGNDLIADMLYADYRSVAPNRQVQVGTLQADLWLKVRRSER